MALAIVEHVLSKLGMKRVANITQYGAATNCFTLAAGLILSGSHDLTSQLFLLDGDLYTTEESQVERANAVLSGTEVDANARRQRCVAGIRKLRATGGIPLAPESQIHRMIRDLPPQHDAGVNEIIDLAQGIQAVDDTHSFVELIIQTLNIHRSAGMSNIVRVAALSPAWQPYVEELHTWLLERRSDVIEDFTPAVPVPVAA